MVIRTSRRRSALYIFASIAALFLLNLYFVGKSTADENGNEFRERRTLVDSEKDVVKTEENADSDIKKVSCSADGHELSCLSDSLDVYFPFSFIKKRFDVTGRHVKDGSKFEWTSSYAKIRAPDFTEYSHKSEFGHFASYSVETRERVRCINPATNIPMSTQWDSTPYYYPIQIAQYGLQHYSRMVSVNASTEREVMLGLEHRDWQGSASTLHESSARTYFKDEETGIEYVNISSGAHLTNAGVYVYLKNEPDLHVVSFRWQPQDNASFTFLVKEIKTGSLILLNYVQGADSRCIWKDGIAGGTDQISFSYSLGDDVSDEWMNVTRDLLVDAARAMSVLGSGKKNSNIIYHPGDLKYVSVGFRGEATLLQRIYQRTSANRELFLTAADWALRAQDEKGGWPVPVERAIADRRLTLPAGWYSAMAQGHMMSLLSRSYLATADERYLNAAVRGLGLFEKLVSNGGVRNDFLGNLPWYEEYPTTPGSFVLNGFMYSLIGLYDLSTVQRLDKPAGNQTVEDGPARASKLFSSGIRSLLMLLPLFDTGSGSIYDLRHVGLGTVPNLARWDYHAVHVYLLHWLHIITGEAQLEETARRWTGYARGQRAKHN